MRQHWFSIPCLMNSGPSFPLFSPQIMDYSWPLFSQQQILLDLSWKYIQDLIAMYLIAITWLWPPSFLQWLLVPIFPRCPLEDRCAHPHLLGLLVVEGTQVFSPWGLPWLKRISSFKTYIISQGQPHQRWADAKIQRPGHLAWMVSMLILLTLCSSSPHSRHNNSVKT